MYNNTLKAIYNSLKNGEKYGKFVYWDYYNNKPMRYPYFHIALSKHDYKNLFLWENYGSSANKATLKDLNWIITEIFNTTPDKFILEYMTETQYNRMMTAIKQEQKTA